ncbi:hypothetical protein U9M48_039238 [Paspalum notatum var. saurae]|uniref:Uncharacterized protein n=1 Tax=Paspalum notatum var. saurae TaxID=547442 RepID=A0AAQ3UJ96_PASNO
MRCVRSPMLLSPSQLAGRIGQPTSQKSKQHAWPLGNAIGKIRLGGLCTCSAFGFKSADADGRETEYAEIQFATRPQTLQREGEANYAQVQTELLDWKRVSKSYNTIYSRFRMGTQ